MFDVFKWAAGTKSAKVTTVKVHGASMKLGGMPEAYTVPGLADLAKAQKGNISVSLPKQVTPEDKAVTGTTTLPGVTPAEAVSLIRCEAPQEAEAPKEATKGKGKKPKAEKEPEDRGGIDPAVQPDANGQPNGQHVPA